jgi:3-methyladenine DNA glycosylase AlkD
MAKAAISPAKLNTRALVTHVQERLAALANAEKAAEMAAYMKTTMPFYGVQKPDREPIMKELKQNFAPASHAQYEAGVLALWRLKHREEKYIAINYAGLFRQFVTPASLPLYERMIRDGQWWDFTDAIASQ